MKADIKNDEFLLIKKIKEKDREAIRTFINTHQDSVFRICFGFVHNREDAEELTQDVLVQVLKNIDDFRGESKLATWIYRICYTKSLNKLKKNRWQKWLQSFDSLLGIATPDTSLGPDREFENQEQHDMLHAAVDQLPDLQKTAFVMHSYEGLKYQEIAEVMKTSVASVESLIFRAKKNLRKNLKGLI